MLGRPTVMTTKTLDKLRIAFLMGYSDREACLYADIGLQTLYDYQNEHPDYSEQKEVYKTKPILMAKKIIFDALKKKETKIAQWYLERKAKDEFSTRIEEICNPIDIEKTLDRLDTDYELVATEAKKQLDRLS